MIRRWTPGHMLFVYKQWVPASDASVSITAILFDYIINSIFSEEHFLFNVNYILIIILLKFFGQLINNSVEIPFCLLFLFNRI